jgi:hypothetical protein
MDKMAQAKAFFASEFEAHAKAVRNADFADKAWSKAVRDKVSKQELDQFARLAINAAEREEQIKGELTYKVTSFINAGLL